MKKRRLIIIGILVVVAAVILSMNAKTLAKYVTDRISSYFIKSKDFYFTSDLLTVEESTYELSSWSGIGAFDVSFNIYSKDNELLYTESDIPYTITVDCPQDVICSPSSINGVLYQSSVNHSENININVSPQRIFIADEVVSVRVTAKSTSPYVKTLKAVFNYKVGKEGVTYEIKDEAGQAYLFLKVTNNMDYCTVREAFSTYSVGDRISSDDYRLLDSNNKKKCVSKYLNVSFSPNNVLLDTTSSIMDDITYTTTTINSISYINSLSYRVAPGSAFQIKFYKTNPLIDNTATVLTNNSILVVSTSD